MIGTVISVGVYPTIGDRAMDLPRLLTELAGDEQRRIPLEAWELGRLICVPRPLVALPDSPTGAAVKTSESDATTSKSTRWTDPA